MEKAIELKKTEKINKFVKGLDGLTLGITRECIALPNTPDCGPTIIRLNIQYGKLLDVALGKIENLRQEIGCSYDYIQAELRKRLY